MKEVKEGLFYSKDHEWIGVNDNKVMLGISDYAQQSLGDITYIELPAEGDELKSSEIVANIESVKAASDIYTPVSGTVTRINLELEDNPELINSSAYDNGWICEMELNGELDSSDLMSAAQYKEYIASL